MSVTIADIGVALPNNVVSNEDLRAQYPDWDFDRLEARTGVMSRHIATDGETALDLAFAACESLKANGALDGIDGLLFCTETPDYPIPSNACLLHGKLELPRNVLALDINMGCSGYLYSLEVARSLITSGAASRILLATADTYSRLINPGDRSTRVLFGDGAAASIITAADDDASGIIDLSLGSEGKFYDRFIVPAGGTRTPLSDATAIETEDRSGNIRTPADITMEGFQVLSFFNGVIPKHVRGVLEANDLTLDDVDLFVFHQASQVALDSIAKALKIPAEKLVNKLATTGNLVSASVPVALAMARDDGTARPGQLAILCGFGVGLSWGTALVRL
ncbi:MAG: ketoacyl-ACP synthase III [Rhodospirillaceae bacterium]|jgi:3-oxoacyl-[acyl-carrier-protein] synthase-3|nr:ketoacyl-ACP synthase III [Rhodospirillaceae bacterium]MBT3931002.1 ketoacyl-ACP synthase III [Rhodospirillaceae bacterium]MBT4772748.1 ketoacyl-ACP synthase III [Rhodospirillaceae bacterium]MBT5359320.1 ketoacyl-ACP synthase III [Rhodospirillaceae bacterium]MBT5771021.1 ketoacyl-ACP synthase III [Rhodospirillaceae bacterium]